MNPVAKYLGFTVAVIAILLGCIAAGWTMRGWRCATALSDYKGSLAQQAQEQREASQAVEAKQETVTDQSTKRLDAQQVAQQKEIVYVDKQVIQYRDRWRDRDCERPDDWVQLYNASLFGDDPAMPEAGPAGSATDGASVLLPAGRN